MSSTLDTVVIVVFSAFILCMGMLFARTGRNIKSFFAGGEAVPWFIGGLSLFMSFFSAGTFVAWGSIAYKYGWVSVTIQWTMAFGALVAGLFIAPRWKRTGNLTAAEYIEQRLGQRVKKLYVYIFMAVSLFIKGAVLYPVAKLISVSLGFPLMPATIVLGIMMIAYTAVGGLWAVMVTDILQFVVLTAAVLIILPLSLNQVGGFAQFTQKAPDAFFNLLNGEYTIWFVLAFGLYHIFYIGGNWTFVQRYTSVDSAGSAKKVALLFALLYVISPVIWMLPPMIYQVINPGLQGLDTENAYLRICQLVLPPGLMGLMLTGMYFSTSATANTTLNVVSAVFTNDVYKSMINPAANDRRLMKAARWSSWFFGGCMIVIALIVPAIGGMVEVVLSIAAVTAGPLLAPSIWALFSKRLSGVAAFWISMISLSVNVVFKLVFPYTIQVKLNRAEEMVLGVGLPLLLLMINELVWRTHINECADYSKYATSRLSAKKEAQAVDPEEAYAIKKQNHFGLRVIAFSLLFTALMIFGLSLVATTGKTLTAVIAAIILVASLIPLLAAKRSKKILAKEAIRLMQSKKMPALILLILMTAPSMAQTNGEDSLSLNSHWAFKTDPDNTGEKNKWHHSGLNDGSWETMHVPSNWDTRNQHAHYAGKAWYRKRVQVPANWKGKQIRLLFEAVYHDSKVWLNDQLLGESRSGFLPFEFDVSAALNYGGKNTIVVCADNSFRRGAIWNWGGIRRPVYIVAGPLVRVTNTFITPAVDLQKRSAEVTMRVLLQHTGHSAEDIEGEVVLSAPNGFRRVLPFTKKTAAASKDEIVLKTTISKKDMHLWSCDDPFLYRSEVRIRNRNGQIHTRQDKFGLRKIELDNTTYTFKLNGVSIRPMGFNLVPDDRTTGNTLPLWRIKEDIDLLKSLGTNMARLSHLPLPKEALDYLDEKGIMIFNEVPLWGFDKLADKDQQLPKDWLQQLINKDYNHACVIGWSVGNEISQYPKVMEYVEDAIHRTHKADPSRLAVVVSHTADWGRDPIDFADMGLINKYGSSIGKLADKIHQLHPGKVLFYTEYGYGQLGEELNTDVNAKAMVDSIRFKPYLIGGSLWTFNDYRSSFYGTKEFSENRPWGVVDVFRQKKKAYYSFQKECAPVRDVQVSGLANGSATIAITPRKQLDLPAYPLHDYLLVWKAIDSAQQVIDGGFIRLPVIQPGDTIFSQPIQWKHNAQIAALQVALVSPLQYTVYDTLINVQLPAMPQIVYAMGVRTDMNNLPLNSGSIRVVFKKDPLVKGYKVQYGKDSLTDVTPLTFNHFIDVGKLAVHDNYRFRLIAVNDKGETATPVQQIHIDYGLAPPVVNYTEPADSGFYVGYATQMDDYLFKVQTTTIPGNYTNADTIQSSTKGVLYVPGLTNGRSYYYRLQRIKQNTFESPWSEEIAVTPDGQQSPAPPELKGLLRKNNDALLFFTPVKKATGYLVQYRIGTGNWSALYINAAVTGQVLLTNVKKGQPLECRMATYSSNGQSSFSTTLTLP